MVALQPTALGEVLLPFLRLDRSHLPACPRAASSGGIVLLIGTRRDSSGRFGDGAVVLQPAARKTTSSIRFQFIPAPPFLFRRDPSGSHISRFVTFADSSHPAPCARSPFKPDLLPPPPRPPPPPPFPPKQRPPPPPL